MNTTPEMYDESIDDDATGMTQEEILMNEDDILAGLLDLGKARNETHNYRLIRIKRNGILKIEFRIRPVSESDNQICWKNATKYARTKPGQPKKAIETDTAKYRSYLIYTATVDEDRKKVWDNRAAQTALCVMSGVDMIDAVLLSGEKDRVISELDEISGYDDEAEDIVGN